MRRNENQIASFNSLLSAGRILAWTFGLLPLFIAGCHKDETDDGKTEVVEVGTISPVRKDMVREVAQPGYLRPYEMTPIYTKIAGYAMEPQCDIGDTVKKGDLLVQLRVPEVDQELKVKKGGGTG